MIMQCLGKKKISINLTVHQSPAHYSKCICFYILKTMQNHEIRQSMIMRTDLLRGRLNPSCRGDWLYVGRYCRLQRGVIHNPLCDDYPALNTELSWRNTRVMPSNTELLISEHHIWLATGQVYTVIPGILILYPRVQFFRCVSVFFCRFGHRSVALAQRVVKTSATDASSGVHNILKTSFVVYHVYVWYNGVSL